MSKSVLVKKKKSTKSPLKKKTKTKKEGQKEEKRNRCSTVVKNLKKYIVYRMY